MRVVLTDELNEKEKNDIWQLLVLCDKEFVPPLSSRENTTQKVLNFYVLYPKQPY